MTTEQATGKEDRVEVEDANNNVLSLKCPKCEQTERFTIDAYGLVDITKDTCTMMNPRVDRGGWARCVKCDYGGDEIAEIQGFIGEVTFNSGAKVLPPCEPYQADKQQYRCNACGESHTRDEIILKANGDLLSALAYAPKADMEEDSPLHALHGAILHALDELGLLDVEGFKHPEEG